MALISIVIPAYNEEKRLPDTLKKLLKFVSSKKINAEIIVVDDGSKDDTAAVVLALKNPKIKLIKNTKNMGKGFSVQNGVKNAKGDIILFTDADMSTPIKHLSEFIQYHKEGYEVVIASRDLVESKVIVPQSPFREISGKVFNLMVRLVTGLPIHDTQCGFKSFTKKASKLIFSKQTIVGFGFDVEILFIAHSHKLSIKEAAVEWYNAPGTKVSFFKDSLRMFAELFKIRLNGLKGIYK
ncbi:MAG: dolichyl-phosphate beta-glucosyltransferase [bacterium]